MIQELTLSQAQAWFEALPRPLQLASLSPAFAAADTKRAPGLRCVHLGWRSGDAAWLHSVHLKPLADSDAQGAIAPYGYGGPLASRDEPAFLQQAWAAYRGWCARHRVLAEFCRFHPEAANHRFFGGQVALNRHTVSVDLREPLIERQYNATTRRKLRRAALLGARARFSCEPGDWRRFAAFYREGMRALGAGPSYLFSDAYFRAIAALPQAWLCICEGNGAWWSAGLYLQGPDVVEYHLGANSPPGLQAGSACLLQDAAARRAQAQGAHSLYLGGGTGPEEDNPLLFYKKSFSRRMLPYFIGTAIHDEDAYWALAGRLGHDRAHPPPRLLFD